MNHIALGVAGHIDHGKTALVRALTGMETDRLPEEKERGMSIALGFAHLTLPEGQIDLIDVPGHEKFIKTMIAGATGVEAVMLIVAATEGIMPQTVEHVALCQLLGIRKGLVVVAKSDLVSEGEERERIAGEIRAFLTETFLAAAPLIFASAVSGEGLVEIQTALSALLDKSEQAALKPGFYLPIDRVFSMLGYGTVATGTLRRSAIRVGDLVQILPSGLQAHVRGLEVHGAAVSESAPGWRTAVNLRGISKEQLSRGDILSSPGLIFPTTLVDAEITLLPARLRLTKGSPKALRHGATVRIYYGTRESMARVHLFDDRELREGESALVQLRFGEPQAVSVNEPFVVRTYSPMETVGGGRVIDVAPVKHTRRDVHAHRRMQILAHGSVAEKLVEKIHGAGYAGREIERLLAELDISPGEWERERSGLPIILCGVDLAIHCEFHEMLTEAMRRHVRAFHAAHPTRRGIPQEELRNLLAKEMALPAYQFALRRLSEQGAFRIESGLVAETDFSTDAALSPIEREIAGKIEKQFAKAGLLSPDPEQVIGADRRRKVLYQYLLDSGTLIATTDRASGRIVAFHKDAVAGAAQNLRAKLSQGQGYTVSELNTLLGITRKYGIPLLEHLDSLRVTRRVGDLRFLSDPPA